MPGFAFQIAPTLNVAQPETKSVCKSKQNTTGSELKALQLPCVPRKAHTVVIWLQNFQQLAQHSDRHITGSSCSNKYSPHCAHHIPAIEGVRNYVNDISLFWKLAQCASVSIQLLAEQLKMPAWQTVLRLLKSIMVIWSLERKYFNNLDITMLALKYLIWQPTGHFTKWMLSSDLK